MNLYKIKALSTLLVVSSIFWHSLSMAQNIYPPESNRSVFLDGGDLQLIVPDTDDWFVKGTFNVDESLSILGGVGLQGQGENLNRYFINFGRTPWTEPGGIFLLPNGNFGVGKSLPETTLDVNGPASCETAFTIGYPNPNHKGIVVDHTENTTWNFLEFKNANGTQLKVDSEGNIEAANAKFCEVLVNEDWCDYVLDEDYDLPTLEEEKKHIEENGHLLGFQSEAAMAGEIALVDVTKKQQVKIEEMMLHMIELSEQIKELKQENERLKRP